MDHIKLMQVKVDEELGNIIEWGHMMINFAQVRKVISVRLPNGKHGSRISFTGLYSDEDVYAKEDVVAAYTKYLEQQKYQTMLKEKFESVRYQDLPKREIKQVAAHPRKVEVAVPQEEFQEVEQTEFRSSLEKI